MCSRRLAILVSATASLLLSAAPVASAPIGEAASFYHQGRYDSALTRLERLKTGSDLKRRDSLSLFQYLGMTSARLGREPEAVGHFSTLLALDSLFQFPRNEDPAVLQAFERARAGSAPTSDNARSAGLPPAAPSTAPPAPTAGPTSDPLARGDSKSVPQNGNPQTVLAGMTLVEAAGQNGRGVVEPPRIGLTLGAMPFGSGWFARNRVKPGLALGFLQAGGLALSVYASEMQTREENDPGRTQDKDELATVRGWQWVQRISLSTAVGAYLFSLIASAGD